MPKPFEAVNQRKITSFFKVLDPNAPPTPVSAANKVQTTLTKHFRRGSGQQPRNNGTGSNSGTPGPSSSFSLPVMEEDIIVLSSGSDTEAKNRSTNNGSRVTSKRKTKVPPGKGSKGKNKSGGSGSSKAPNRKRKKNNDILSDSDTDVQSLHSAESEDDDPSSDFELELRSTRSHPSSVVKTKRNATVGTQPKINTSKKNNGNSNSSAAAVSEENVETQVINIFAPVPVASSTQPSPLPTPTSFQDNSEASMDSANNQPSTSATIIKGEKDATSFVPEDIKSEANEDSDDSDASVSLLPYEKTPPKVYTIEDSTDMEDSPRPTVPVDKNLAVEKTPKQTTNMNNFDDNSVSIIEPPAGVNSNSNDLKNPNAHVFERPILKPFEFERFRQPAVQMESSPSTHEHMNSVQKESGATILIQVLSDRVHLEDTQAIPTAAVTATGAPVEEESTQVIRVAITAAAAPVEEETQVVFPLPCIPSTANCSARANVVPLVFGGKYPTKENCYSAEIETQLILPPDVETNENEQETQAMSPRVFGGEKNEFIAQINDDMPSGSTSSTSNQSPSALRTNGDNQLMLSPAISPSLIRKTPTKSPKTKACYLSPVRHVRNLSRISPNSPARNGSLVSTPSPSTSRKVSPPIHSSQQSSGSSMISPAKTSPRKLNWSQSGDPYYLEHFRSIVDSVRADSHYEHLLNGTDAAMVSDFNNLTRPSQCLYVRLFQRKWNWKCAASIKYPHITENLMPGFEELHRNNFLSEIKDATLDLPSLLDLLSMEQMSALGKKMNLNPQVKTKDGYKTALMKMVKTQRTLRGSSEDLVRKGAIDQLGPTYQVSESSRRLFSRLFILYSPPQYWDDEANQGSNQILAILLINTGKVQYPEYDISKSHQIYGSRADLVRFQTAWTYHSDIQGQLESKDWAEAKKILHEALDMLKFEILSISDPKSSIQKHDLALPDFLRAYTAGSVLTRTVWLGIDAYQKTKDYIRANEIIAYLLNQTLYLRQYRGRWHDRLFVNSKHLKQSNRELRKLIKAALDDQFLGDAHRHGFSLRLPKFTKDETVKGKPKPAKKAINRRKTRSRATIESSGSEEEVESDDPSQYSIFSLKYEVPERTIEGEQLSLNSERSYGKSVFLGAGSSSTPSGKNLSSVELFAMEFYKTQGYTQGLHAEGDVPVAVFGLLFWDVIYDGSIPDAFHSPFQPFPLDFHFKDFYIRRRTSVDDMLLNLRAKWSLNDSFEVIESNWEKHNGKLSVVNWAVFESIQVVKDLVKCMGLQMIAGICERLSMDFRYYRSGFPDLIVWNGLESDCLFAEVKGPGDKLSSKQSIWLDYLISIGAKAEVCHVKSVSHKKIRLS